MTEKSLQQKYNKSKSVFEKNRTALLDFYYENISNENFEDMLKKVIVIKSEDTNLELTVTSDTVVIQITYATEDLAEYLDKFTQKLFKENISEHEDKDVDRGIKTYYLTINLSDDASEEDDNTTTNVYELDDVRDILDEFAEDYDGVDNFYEQFIKYWNETYDGAPPLAEIIDEYLEEKNDANNVDDANDTDDKDNEIYYDPIFQKFIDEKLTKIPPKKNDKGKLAVKILLIDKLYELFTSYYDGEAPDQTVFINYLKKNDFELKDDVKIKHYVIKKSSKK